MLNYYFNFIFYFFRPSTSKDEKLPMKYYEAEIKGIEHECTSYVNECPMGIFDFITLLEQ